MIFFLRIIGFFIFILVIIPLLVESNNPLLSFLVVMPCCILFLIAVIFSPVYLIERSEQREAIARGRFPTEPYRAEPVLTKHYTPKASEGEIVSIAELRESLLAELDATDDIDAVIFDKEGKIVSNIIDKEGYVNLDEGGNVTEIERVSLLTYFISFVTRRNRR